MARYLVYTSPARGHLYPIVPTLNELQRRGHEVAVRTLAPEVGLLRSLGFAAAPLDPAIAGLSKRSARMRCSLTSTPGARWRQRRVPG
jgi:UDP:flavonoid glycosyltransferase YjiC (YdhE family)